MCSIGSSTTSSIGGLSANSTLLGANSITGATQPGATRVQGGKSRTLLGGGGASTGGASTGGGSSGGSTGGSRGGGGGGGSNRGPVSAY